ncbi:MAG: DUF503 domain-containing protein [Chloroflexi bacterium]|nr:DUF503 domain-containing protein [Chloroflexota bacterium]
MQVGMGRLALRLPENATLKGKRQVARSIISRVRSRFNVSIAEVDDNDKWQILSLGVTCVSNDARHANEVLSRVMDYIQAIRGDAELLDYEIELVAGL